MIKNRDQSPIPTGPIRPPESDRKRGWIKKFLDWLAQGAKQATRDGSCTS
ncbi:MAG: hypothetical protein HQK59_14145 [Deltaproteobacteria bacterium]|nr:hypothetical protein [Deltaproteobacteria bacterium]